MNERRIPANERRRFLKLLGGSAALIPVIGLTACGGEPESGAAKTETPKPAPAARPDPAKPAAPPADPGSMQTTPPGGGDLPRLSLDDPQAKALGYVHDATTVDKAAQPRYEPGQACKNCALFTGGDQPWGGCGLFVGKSVAAAGWCSAYAPKPA